MCETGSRDWRVIRNPSRGPRLHAPFAVREELVRVCRCLADRELIAGQDGNVSVLVGVDRILVTPSGFAKGQIDADDLVEVSLSGAHLAGRYRASSELALHLAAYGARAEIRAVVHAHPPTATAFSLRNETIPDGVLAELMLTVGPVALAPYVQPGTVELGTSIVPYLRDHDVVLLAHHGAVSVGRSLREAHFRMESLEHGAKIIHLARQLGSVVTLDSAAREALRAARRGARNTAAAEAATQERQND